MDIWAWGGLAALSAGVMSIWSQVRMFFGYLTTFVVVRAELEYTLAGIVFGYARQRGRAAPFGPSSFAVFSLYVPTRQQSLRMLFVGSERACWWFRDGWRVYLLQAKPGAQHTPDTAVIWGLRGFSDVPKLLQQACDWEAEQMRVTMATPVVRHFGYGRMGKREAGRAGSVYSREEAPSLVASKDDFPAPSSRWQPCGWGFELLQLPASQSFVRRLSLSRECEQFLTLVSQWKEDREWYATRGVPWRLGALLYGPPGTGKTAYARAVAEKLNATLHMIDLASMTVSELQAAWESTQRTTPVVILLEDFDAVFDGRTPAADVELTFDAVLNMIDGPGKEEGVVTLITTNHPEKLDPAIAQVGSGDVPSRPGRIDFMLRFDALSAAGRRQIASRVLADWPDSVEEMVSRGEHETGAQFEFRCVEYARQRRFGSHGLCASNETANGET